MIWLNILKTIAPVLLVSLIFLLTSSWIILRILARFYTAAPEPRPRGAGYEVGAEEEYAWGCTRPCFLGDQAARIAREKFLADLLAANRTMKR
jgi:hypothetical protein